MTNKEAEIQFPQCTATTEDGTQCVLDEGHEIYRSKKHVVKTNGAIIRWTSRGETTVELCHDFYCIRCGDGYFVRDRGNKQAPSRYGDLFCSQHCFSHHRKSIQENLKALAS